MNELLQVVLQNLDPNLGSTFVGYIQVVILVTSRNLTYEIHVMYVCTPIHTTYIHTCARTNTHAQAGLEFREIYL